MKNQQIKNFGSDNKELIKQLVYPESFKDKLAKIEDCVIDALKHDRISSKTGTLELRGVPKEADIPLLYFYWFAENCEIIENLNLVLTDLYILSEKMFMFEGSPKTRFYLLTRLYFYEFYRFREIFNVFMKAFQNRGIIKSKEELKQARNLFNKEFEEMIKLRNTMVHDSPIWKGKEHLDLITIDAALKFGYGLVDLKSNQKVSYQNILARLCKKYTKDLLQQGQAMSEMLQNMLDITARWLKLKKMI